MLKPERHPTRVDGYGRSGAGYFRRPLDSWTLGASLRRRALGIFRERGGEGREGAGHEGGGGGEGRGIGSLRCDFLLST